MKDRETQNSQANKPESIFVKSNTLSPEDRKRIAKGAGEIIDRDKVTRRQLGEVKFELYKTNVAALIGGESLPLAAIKEQGLDSRALMNKARSIINSFHINSGGIRAKGFGQGDISWSDVKGGTDPHVFEGGSGHRRGLGDI